MRIGGDGRESACVLCVFWLETRLMTVKHTHSHTHSHTHTHTHTHTLEALRIARRIRHAHILAVKAHHLRVARRLHGHAVVLARGQVKPAKKNMSIQHHKRTSRDGANTADTHIHTHTHTHARMRTGKSSCQNHQRKTCPRQLQECHTPSRMSAASCQSCCTQCNQRRNPKANHEQM